MSAKPLRFWLAAMLGMAWLAACAPVPVRTGAPGIEAAQVARELAFAGRRDWSFTGRLAVANGGDGGSGRIDWRQAGEDYDIRLSAPVTHQGWRLHREHGRVILDGLPGGPREGNDAEALLLEATGWRLPVADMAYWVRGLRAPGMAQLTGDASGRPAMLEQAGWRVEYRAWSADAPPLPLRITAGQGDASVHLAVDAWATP
jgi:outer membrane lipoprotein LolB